jgi:hypothetical protein
VPVTIGHAFLAVALQFYPLRNLGLIVVDLMNLTVKHLKLRLVAGLTLALTGNASAAASPEDRAILNFKPASAVMRPQTQQRSNVDYSTDGGSTVKIPVHLGPALGTPAPVVNTPAITQPVVARPAPALAPRTIPNQSNSVLSQPTSQGTSPISNSPVTLAPRQPIAEPNQQTTAGTILPSCPTGNCSPGIRRSQAAEPIPSHAAGLDAGNYHSAQEACYSRELLNAAKANVADRFGNRPHSKGKCAYGVRTSINRAGIYGGALGNAVDYQVYGKAASIGMKNFINEYGDDMSKIPAGAVLVFAGPHLNEYLRTGYEGPRGSKGQWLGHVTIKGDDGKFYTDGREDHPALGWPKNKSRRRLVGVYLMQQCTSSCSPRLRAKCG